MDKCMESKDIINILRTLAKYGIMFKADLIKQCNLSDERALNSSFTNLMQEQGLVASGIGYDRIMITDRGLAWLFYFDYNSREEVSEEELLEGLRAFRDR